GAARGDVLDYRCSRAAGFVVAAQAVEAYDRRSPEHHAQDDYRGPDKYLCFHLPFLSSTDHIFEEKIKRRIEFSLRECQIGNWHADESSALAKRHCFAAIVSSHDRRGQ